MDLCQQSNVSDFEYAVWQADTENHSLPWQEPGSWSICGTRGWGRKTWTVTAEEQEAVWTLTDKHSGSQWLGKIPHASSRRKEKEWLKICQSTLVLLSNVCPQETDLLGVMSESKWSWGKKYPHRSLLYDSYWVTFWRHQDYGDGKPSSVVRAWGKVGWISRAQRTLGSERTLDNATVMDACCWTDPRRPTRPLPGQHGDMRKSSELATDTSVVQWVGGSQVWSGGVTPTTTCGWTLGRTRWPSAGGGVGVDGEMTSRRGIDFSGAHLLPGGPAEGHAPPSLFKENDHQPGPGVSRQECQAWA